MHSKVEPAAAARPSRRAKLTAGALAAAALALAAAFGLGSGRGPAEDLFGANLAVLTPAAFLAGVLSFLSPCTLPILPAYFAFSFQARRGSIVLTTVAFFLGLATTLTLLGASATALGQLLFHNLRAITLAGGLVIMGLGLLTLLGRGFAGLAIAERPAASVAGSYLYGATFALGWTACLGPILGAILTLLATQGVAVLQGAFLAFVYALGLGAPLILVATFFGRLGSGSRFWTWMRGRGVSVRAGPFTLSLHTTSVASGLLLIGVGYLLASGQLATLTAEAGATSLSQWVIDTEAALHRLLGLR